jgi:5-dehydro-2-deoxygluconokinase
VTAQFEVLTMGRIGVDIYPLQVGVPLEDVTSFGKYLGGSAANVAVAASRLGRRSAVITRTGDDPFGRFLHQALHAYGVDDRYVMSVPELPTPVTFCEIFPPDDFPIYFYRYPKAPDLEVKTGELHMAAIRAADVFWATVTGLSQEPSRSATLAALAERTRSGVTVLDLDYRPTLWPYPEEARHWTQAALRYATVAVGNLQECEMATGTSDPESAGEALRDFGVDLAVVKQGPGGVLALDSRCAVRVPPVSVEVVNGIGAGDAFGGALCHGLLAGWETAEVMRFANAAGAIVASRLSCADAMPTRDEVQELLAEHADAR